MKKFYVTTPIYYVNDKPHIGHAYTTIIADVFARYYRQKIGKENVFFLTGTDEHGAKIIQAAKKNNQSPRDFVDQVSNQYQVAWKALGISNDYFFRTTNPNHKKTVQDMLQTLYDKGYIYKSLYKGIYCVGCEKYLTEDEIINEKCPHHPTTELTEQEEENYFFKLRDLTPKVLEALETEKYRVLPIEKRNEILGKIRGGINDISISRTGVDWGIPVPWDNKHTVYVWVDALFNYYSATRIIPQKEHFWPVDLHLMAKDILWFHALIWEALLLALDKELHKVIFAHGFFSIDGQKMSKSLGNIIDPLELVNSYGTDGLRYLLLTSFAIGNDGDISLSKFKEKYNSDLANGIGNLVSRIARLCEQSKYNFIPVFEKVKFKLDLSIEKAMTEYRPDEAIKIIWNQIQKFDKDIHNEQPWTLSGEKLQKILESYIERIIPIAHNLKPFLPDTAEKIIAIFGTEKIIKPESLFRRKNL